MKYKVKFTNQFKKDLKLAKKQNKDLDKLFETVNILASGGTILSIPQLMLQEEIIIEDDAEQ